MRDTGCQVPDASARYWNKIGRIIVSHRVRCDPVSQVATKLSVLWEL